MQATTASTTARKLPGVLNSLFPSFSQHQPQHQFEGGSGGSSEKSSSSSTEKGTYSGARRRGSSASSLGILSDNPESSAVEELDSLGPAKGKGRSVSHSEQKTYIQTPLVSSPSTAWERRKKREDKQLDLLDTSASARSSSLPDIDITSPVLDGESSSTHTRRYTLWLDDSQLPPKQQRKAVPTTSTDDDQGAPPHQSTKKSPRQAQADLTTDSEAEDCLFGFHSTPTASRRRASKKSIMPRSSSSHAKGRSEPGAALSTSSSKRRNSKQEDKVLDRHELMRRAMAEATSADIGAPDSPDSEGYHGPSLVVGNGNSNGGPASVPAGAAPVNAAAAVTTMKASGSNGSTASSNLAQLDKPGDGHLTFDSFVRPGEGEFVVHADAPDGTNGEADGASSTTGGPGPPKRPKMGSRNNSFQGGEHRGAAVDTPTATHDTFLAGGLPGSTPSSSNSIDKITGHAKYSTTGSLVEPAKSRQTSLAVPGSNGMLQASSEAHQMHHSATTGNLAPSPLSRFRKLSDAGLSPNKKGSGDSSKKAGPAGGIAGALAASGMAGMGVGNQAMLQQGQQALAQPKTISPPHRRAGSRRNSSLDDDFVAGYQGGVYRDPSTGTVIEKGPDSEDEREQHERRMQMMRSRSATGSTLSLASSDLSNASGLNAAANFSAAVAAQTGVQAGLLTPDVYGVHSDRSPMTPDGMGGVAGLSPGGQGERVSLGDEAGWPGDMGGQITGFAVASSKRNAEFHALFPTVPEDDYLIEDYGCALVREILIQGRFYISENHVCFYASIFGWVTNIALPFSEIVSIEKRMTAFVIPNAIQVATLHAKHTFASFLSRDATYDLIVNIWKLSHPDVPVDPQHLDLLTDGEESVDDQAETDKAAQGDKSKVSKRARLKKKLGAKLREGTRDDTTQPAGADAKAGIAPSKSPGPGGKRQPHRKTSCPCDKDKMHLSTTVLDTTYPAIPEKVYNLVFTSEFMKDFWTNDQKLLDLQVSNWAPGAGSGSQKMLTRNISYIKPLAGGFGPKQTKCVLTDENIHVDFDDYVTVVTTTRTPDVPSGGSFCVKTRTCFSWAGGNVTKVLVTCQVEWSGRSMIKGIIDKASIDGQKQYYKDLDAAIRQYVKDHASEFREEGDDGEAAEVTADGAEAGSAVEEKENGTREEETAAASSLDGLMGNLGVLKDVASGAFDMLSNIAGGLGDALGGASPSMLILGFVVILLVISNLWAFSSPGTTRDPLDPHRLREPASNRSPSSHQHDNLGAGPEAVAGAIREVLKEYFEPQHAHTSGSRVVENAQRQSPRSPVAPIKPSEDPVAEAKALVTILDDVEQRLAVLRQQIGQLSAAAKEEL